MHFCWFFLDQSIYALFCPAPQIFVLTSPRPADFFPCPAPPRPAEKRAAPSIPGKSIPKRFSFKKLQLVDPDSPKNSPSTAQLLLCRERNFKFDPILIGRISLKNKNWNSARQSQKGGLFVLTAYYWNIFKSLTDILDPGGDFNEMVLNQRSKLE